MLARFPHWLLLALLLGSTAFAAEPTEQRRAFLAARQALAAGDEKTFARLSDGLQDYALYPYLRYGYLSRKLEHVPEREIRAFLTDYADVPLSARLRNAWLHRLARAQRWRDFLAVYQDANGQDTTLKCHQLVARLRSGDTDGLLPEIEQVWLAGRSLPQECDPAFDHLYASKDFTGEVVWERVRLAMDQGQTGLATWLGKKLGNTDRAWVERWIQMYRRPAVTLENPGYGLDSPIAREIVAYGLRRLARGSAETAHYRWQQIQARGSFAPEQAATLARDLAVSAAYQRHPQALAWLNAVDESAIDARVREWRLRAALGALNWEAALAAAQALEHSEPDSEAWRFWRARALEQRGEREAAYSILDGLAQERSFHGFLAADLRGASYLMNDRPIAFEEQELAAMAALPALVRAHELLQLDLRTEARREWIAAIRNMDARQLQLAAVLAQRWGWHEQAIMTVAKAPHWDDLQLRFPTLFREQVLDNARKHELDPAWIYGILRQESAFMVDARSSAGALGLMQLMPATAKHTTRLFDLPRALAGDLLRANSNIRLGSAYLRHVLDTFDGSALLATAAYNAGPGRVQSWLPQDGTLPADVWVETIPFTETRRYVQSVMAYATVYDARLERPVVPLLKRMGREVAAPSRN